MKYISTRGQTDKTGFTRTLLNGLAADGGLYVPETFPEIDNDAIRDMGDAAYVDIAARVMAPYMDAAFPPERLRHILASVYGPDSGIFRETDVAPLRQIGENSWLLELFHGPTLAFKDIALQLLGRLFDAVLEDKGQQLTIIGATSGDTGSAAIAACQHCKNVRIFILHPKGRVSEVQRRQMTTVDADNVFNIAVDGTFDDCQALVKAMFNDPAFRAEQNLSAVNSINWARILAQSVYYFAAAARLGAPDRHIRFAVPTGNFGNVLAGHIARSMGLGIEELIIASNANDILTRFFETGIMQPAGVTPTLSPSMDIQISSNFERYLFELLDSDSAQIRELMDSFKTQGRYRLGEEKMARARQDFTARRVDDEQTRATMARCYQETGRLIDPHTAVGLAAGTQCREDQETPLVNLACAHPAKFPEAVEQATGIHPDLPEEMQDLYSRDEHYTVLENSITRVQDFIRHA